MEKNSISHVEMMSCFFWKLQLRYKRFLIYDTVVLSQVLLSIDVFISATAFLSSLLLGVQADIIKGAWFASLQQKGRRLSYGLRFMRASKHLRNIC